MSLRLRDLSASSKALHRCLSHDLINWQRWPRMGDVYSSLDGLAWYAVCVCSKELVGSGHTLAGHMLRCICDYLAS